MFIVTGANGFIGSAMVRELNARGIQDILAVDVVSLRERPEPLQNAKYARFLTSEEFLDWAQTHQSAHEVKAVFHMGAISDTTETDWDKLRENNIDFSAKVFELCKVWQCPFIYASSGAVYGLGEHGFSPDVDPAILQPLNLYGRSKKEFDIQIQAQPDPGIKWAGLRFFNVYGPNEYHKGAMASVVYKSFMQIKTGGQVQLFRSQNKDFADGEQLRDFVYVKDITRWMWEIYVHSDFPSGFYNLGFGQARSWLDLAKNTFHNMGVAMKIDWIDMPATLSKQYQYFTEAKMQKSFAAGLTTPAFSLEKGIEDYLKNYLLTDSPYL